MVLAPVCRKCDPHDYEGRAALPLSECSANTRFETGPGRLKWQAVLVLFIPPVDKHAGVHAEEEAPK